MGKQAGTPVSCSRCGATAASLPLTWTLQRDGRGRREYLCERCTREHARDIEAKTATEWW